MVTSGNCLITWCFSLIIVKIKYEKQVYFQGPIGAIIIFRQCVSQKHGFLFLEKILGVSQKCGV